jgi:cytochrome P450
MFTETLRKYPVLPFLDRMCDSDYKLPSASGRGTVILPKGTGVYLPVFALHHDSQYFPDPDKFDPERFTQENKQNRPNYTYLPFGEGPRICIGKNKCIFMIGSESMELMDTEDIILILFDFLMIKIFPLP